MSWLEREGRPASAVTLSRSYATTVEDLWDAVTNGERISRWFLTISGELETWRPLPIGRQCGWRHCSVRTAVTFFAHVGVRRRRKLGGGASFRRCRRPHETRAHAYGAPFGTLGRVWARRDRGWMGIDSAGTRGPHRAIERRHAGRIRFFRLTARKGAHRRQQRRVGEGVGRGRNTAGGRPRGCSAHDRVLHRWICGTCVSGCAIGFRRFVTVEFPSATQRPGGAFLCADEFETGSSR